MACSVTPPVTGIDRHPWAVSEAKWTYRALGVDGRARQGDITRPQATQGAKTIVAGYVLNELSSTDRERLLERLVEAAEGGGRLLVVEPVARRLVPWWPSAEARIRSLAGGRADEWRFPVELPASLQLFDRAAGLNHRELTARSLYCPGR
jgi:hypothetical protein